MNRNLLVAAAVCLIAGILGFVANVPVAGWALLVVGLLLIIGSVARRDAAATGAATTNVGLSGDRVDLSPNEGVVDYASPTLGTPGPVNPGAPVNAGPPHIPESRDDPFGNNGPVSGL